MSLEKSIEKLTNAITAAKQSVNMNPSEPARPIGLPPKKAICKTEYVGTWPDVQPMCVCRSQMKGDNKCVVQSFAGVCTLDGYETTVPVNTPCQGGQSPGTM